MKVLLDACVLFPTVMREMLLGVAEAGLFQPLWSERILEEWARAARKIGPGGEAAARIDVALLRDRFPGAIVAPAPGLETRLHLPDSNDLHVLAAAITGSADVLLTMNARDFPRGTLAGEGLERRDPDSFLWQLWSQHPDTVANAAEALRLRASQIDGQDRALKPLLKKARLSRLAKALTA